MTRRPIFIGIATALALTLMVGLAYGAGRTFGSRSNQAIGHRQVATTQTHRAFADHHREHGSALSPMFMHRMDRWMRDWMRDHRWNADHRSMAGQTRSVAGSPSGAGDYSGGHHRHSYTGIASPVHRHMGGHHHEGHHDGGWGHDCW